MPRLSAGDLAELRTTVTEVPGWQLGGDQWARVDAALRELEAALAAGDADGARAAWAGLEHLSPQAARTPLTRLAGPSPSSRELVNRLIDAVDLRLRAGQEELDAENSPNPDQ